MNVSEALAVQLLRLQSVRTGSFVLRPLVESHQPVHVTIYGVRRSKRRAVPLYRYQLQLSPYTGSPFIRHPAYLQSI